MQELTEFFTHLFGVESWPPRWHCGRWTDFHGWLYIISDLLIWAAYFTIPFTLAYFILRRKETPFTSVFWLFALFIFACGATHLVDAAMFWWPAYRLNALVRLLTAIASWATIWTLVKLAPQIMLLRTPTELEEIVQERTMQLQQANRQLEQAHEELEKKVIQRNHELELLTESQRMEIIRLKSRLASGQ